MTGQEANPYQAPESVVDSTESGRLSNVFERFTTWAVFGLSIITLGIYSVYWLYSRTRQINEFVPNPISQGLKYTAIVCFGCSVLANFVSLVDPAIGGVLSLIGLIGTVLYIIWAFAMRNRIHAYLGIGPKDPRRLGPILTFFLSVYYLQYKINKFIDQE